MNDNKEFQDVFSGNEEAEKENRGFDFPKPPVNKSQSEAYAEPEKKETARYFEITQKTEMPKAQFNPYEPSPNREPQGQRVQNTQSFNYVNSQHTAPSYEEPPKKGRGKKLVGIFVAICAVAAVVLIAAGLFNNNGDIIPNIPGTSESTQNAPADMPQVSTTSPGKIENVNSVWVADKVRPSVVGVMTYKNGQLAGEGSGVLWMEKEGYTYVITCAHVIDAKGVSFGVLLLSGKNYEATLVGADTRTDIGVVKIKATGLPLAEFGDSSTLKIGEPVYAIGNPGGSEYFGSFTDGIVSAIDRSVTATYKMTCIQHNAAINPGNSGGGMFDGKEDHVWMDKKGFEKFKVGDSVEFFAEVYRYVKTGNGKQIDFGLRNPEGIKQIPSYKLPTDEELAEQSIMMIICETCHLSEHCNRTVCMRPKKEINQLKKSMKDLIMK